MINYVQTTGLHKIFTNSTFTEFTPDAIASGVNSDSIIYIICLDDTSLGSEFTDGKTLIWAKGNFYAGGNKFDILLPVTYDELKQLRDTNMLVPGQQYRITDYVTTVANYDSAWSAGHPFDVIVTADSNNKLNENARAIQREGDEYFKDHKLESWELKYCLDNDSTRFDWAADEASLQTTSKTRITHELDLLRDYSDSSYNKQTQIAYGNNVYVAVGLGSVEQDIAIYSTDGINWNTTSLPFAAHWTSVAYGDGKFIAVNTSNNRSAWSEDGITWNAFYIMHETVDYIWCSIAYGNGTFIALSNSDNGVIARSIDAIEYEGQTSWYPQNMREFNDGCNWKYIDYINDKFVIAQKELGDTSTVDYTIYSEDGKVWNKLDNQCSIHHMTYGNGMYVGLDGTLSYSSDFYTWNNADISNISTIEDFNCTCSCYGNGNFVHLGFSSTSSYVIYSVDGITWNYKSIPLGVYSSIIYNDNNFTAIGIDLNGNGKVITSADGITWYDYIVEEVNLSMTSKGVIYYLKDEFGNECSYDFKNVLYKRYKITDCPKHPDWVGTYHGMSGTNYETIDKNDFQWYYTFSLNKTENPDDEINTLLEEDVIDVSGGFRISYEENGEIFKELFPLCQRNKIDITYGESNLQYDLPNIVHRKLPNSDFSICGHNTYNLAKNITSSIFGTMNIQLTQTSNYTSGCNISSGIIKSGDQIQIGNGCSNWTCGDNCENWSCGNTCSNWSCGDNCSNWTCGDLCVYWTCGNGCSNWTCGDNCNTWSCGDNCNTWSCGSTCYAWTCGNYCSDWKFGDGTTNKSYCANITIDNGCKYFYLTSSNTTSASSLLQNIHVMSGVKGTSSNPLLIDVPDVGADYTIEINKNKKIISL